MRSGTVKYTHGFMEKTISEINNCTKVEYQKLINRSWNSFLRVY